VFGDGLGVVLHGGHRRAMAHELLHHLEVFAVGLKQR